MLEITSSYNAPPIAFKESALSIIATAFKFPKASAISSAGKGLNTRTLTIPALIPFSLNSSTTVLVVPAVEFIQTTAISASSILYSSKNEYFLPVIFSKSLATSKITFLAFLIASACWYLCSNKYDWTSNGPTAIGSLSFNK